MNARWRSRLSSCSRAVCPALDQKTRLWHWPDVAHWLTEHDKAKLDIDPEAADLVAALNAAYDLREHTRRLPNAALALFDEALSASRLARP
jgi:hypothetical protein